MNLPTLLHAFFIAWGASGSELPEKYLQDTIKSLRLRTSGRNALASAGNSRPTLDTLALRRVSHDALSAEVDKLVDSVAGMFSAASLSGETRPAPLAPPALPANPPPQEYHDAHSPVPALHLTKTDLAKMYADALHKGDTIKLDAGDGNDNQPLTAAVHEVDEEGRPGRLNLNAAQRPNNGYYYYYYPLKSFLDELASSPSQLSLSHNASGSNSASIRKTGQLQNGHSHKIPSYRPPPQQYHRPHDPYYHSHTHQHNVHVYKQPDTMPAEDKKKGLEPLFMAISGFVGMSVMFVLAALFLPKLHRLRPKGLRKEDADDYGIGRVALEAMDGYDCAERFACEAGKAAHAFGLLNNGFVKLLRRIGPYAMTNRLGSLVKYTNEKYRCGVIRCRQRGGAKPPLIGQT